MKRFILSLVIFFCINIGAEAVPPQVTIVPTGQVLTAKYIQYRHLKGIPKPLKSEGQMVLWEGKGLLWQTTSPFPNLILITKGGLYQLDKKTKTSIVKAGGDSAVFNAMAGIFSFSMGKDINGFSVEELPANNNNWQVRLTPKQDQVKNFIQSISVEGNQHITHIRITRPNGDYDEIHLTNHVIKNSISPELRSAFDD